jgi:hypothetical protein
MAKRFVLPIAVAVLVVAATVPVFAQEGDRSVPACGLSSGYVSVHDFDLEENVPAGWYFSAAGNPSRWFGVAGPRVPSIAARASAPVGTGPLATAAAREVERLARVAAARHARGAEQSRAEGRNWISRHPVLFGAMVGAGVGAVAAGTMENELFCSGGDDDCIFYGGGRALTGAGIGAGVGAVVGVIVSAVRD